MTKVVGISPYQSAVIVVSKIGATCNFLHYVVVTGVLGFDFNTNIGTMNLIYLIYFQYMYIFIQYIFIFNF